jgi:hypothetical protein
MPIRSNPLEFHAGMSPPPRQKPAARYSVPNQFWLEPEAAIVVVEWAHFPA